MSYDIRYSVKVEGCDKYAPIGRPEYDSPTYNLTDMFRACMGWDFKQGEQYKASDAIEYLSRGIDELEKNEDEYKQYDSPNGWGVTTHALRDLRSARDDLFECIDDYDLPVDCVYFSW